MTTHWETDRDFLGALKAILLDPVAYFRVTPKEGPLRDPLIFGAILGTIGLASQAIWSLLFSAIGLNLAKFLGPISGESVFGAGEDQTWEMIGNLVMLLASPVIAVVSLFFFSAVFHLILSLFGGVHGNFDATFRAVSYAQAPNILCLIPICGGMIGGIWSIVLYIIGIMEIHETTGVKASCVVLAPLLFCCACCVALLVLGIVAGISAAGLAGA